ncbi:hypothetical protein CAEBREN_01639 [Caenorhabditis brenneri]|uniref:Uncharacterized protein n=1 Tax=Caenorhabditis brenneri TaxID=135651 RepID=G0NTZ0_CAEBE|nr:hypothetical protein CAEBREN_01639 [Caenorhabditis brenneri]
MKQLKCYSFLLLYFLFHHILAKSSSGSSRGSSGSRSSGSSSSFGSYSYSTSYSGSRSGSGSGGSWLEVTLTIIGMAIFVCVVSICCKYCNTEETSETKPTDNNSDFIVTQSKV